MNNLILALRLRVACKNGNITTIELFTSLEMMDGIQRILQTIQHCHLGAGRRVEYSKARRNGKTVVVQIYIHITIKHSITQLRIQAVQLIMGFTSIKSQTIVTDCILFWNVWLTGSIMNCTHDVIIYLIFVINYIIITIFIINCRHWNAIIQ